MMNKLETTREKLVYAHATLEALYRWEDDADKAILIRDAMEAIENAVLNAWITDKIKEEPKDE